MEERRWKDLKKKHNEFTGFSRELYVENSKKKENEEDKKDEEGVDGDDQKIEEVDVEKEKKEIENEESERGVPPVGATQQEQNSLDAKVGGCDHRRAHLVLQIVV